MKLLYAGLGLLVLCTFGCDTPWAAAQRERESKEHREAEWKAQRERAKAEQAKTVADEKKRAADVELYLAGEGSNSTPQIAAAIRSGKTIVRGMTIQEFLFVMPKPDVVNVSTGSFGRHEQWVYRVFGEGNRYYYFKNGILDAWQTRE